jgi:hypothetical protein
MNAFYRDGFCSLQIIANSCAVWIYASQEDNTKSLILFCSLSGRVLSSFFSRKGRNLSRKNWVIKNGQMSLRETLENEQMNRWPTERNTKVNKY